VKRARAAEESLFAVSEILRDALQKFCFAFLLFKIVGASTRKIFPLENFYRRIALQKFAHRFPKNFPPKTLHTLST